MPVTELTMEQDFQFRKIQDLLLQAQKEDIITIFLALQKQNYCLSNTIKKLLSEWPIHPSHPTITPEEYPSLGFYSRSRTRISFRQRH